MMYLFEKIHIALVLLSILALPHGFNVTPRMVAADEQESLKHIAEVCCCPFEFLSE